MKHAQIKGSAVDIPQETPENKRSGRDRNHSVRAMMMCFTPSHVGLSSRTSEVSGSQLYVLTSPCGLWFVENVSKYANPDVPGIFTTLVTNYIDSLEDYL